ncbi:MAG: 6-pyruvoyl tetrahydropterin reductase [Oceanospirillales bacterium LUC14_002_19_P2]|nr:MAG: 6-pyruvoyl tetrahydropterin reductase [Oceanospirillales bacterium LUC14_002_19_P2]
MSALFVNQMTTIDFSYLCPERGLVGESLIVDVILNGDLNDEGMVFDFSHVKKQIKQSIDHSMDHTLLVPAECAAIEYCQEDGRIDVTLHTHELGYIQCRAPEQAITLLPLSQITPEALQPLLEQQVMADLPENVSGVELRLYPETIYGAWYHYSHGLKKHQGDCQRIAHGHRSAIQILLNNQRSESHEQDWANRWQDIYLATREDLLTTFTVQDRDYHRFGYTAQQGYFEISLLASRCYLIDTDTTVELLADHMAKTVANENPGQSIRAIAYEGFQKGAVADAQCQPSMSALLPNNQNQ